MNLEFIPADFSQENILIEMSKKFYLHESIDFIEDNIRNLFGEILNNSSLGKIYFLMIDDEAAGYFLLTYAFSFEFKGRYIFLDEFYIREKFRGKGFGKKALSFIDKIAKEERISVIRLEVSRKNKTASNLYKSVDFIDYNRDLLTKHL